jgi:hypothetical protein
MFMLNAINGKPDLAREYLESFKLDNPTEKLWIYLCTKWTSFVGRAILMGNDDRSSFPNLLKMLFQNDIPIAWHLIKIALEYYPGYTRMLFDHVRKSYYFGAKLIEPNPHCKDIIAGILPHIKDLEKSITISCPDSEYPYRYPIPLAYSSKSAKVFMNSVLASGFGGVGLDIDEKNSLANSSAMNDVLYMFETLKYEGVYGIGYRARSEGIFPC